MCVNLKLELRGHGAIPAAAQALPNALHMAIDVGEDLHQLGVTKIAIRGFTRAFPESHVGCNWVFEEICGCKELLLRLVIVLKVQIMYLTWPLHQVGARQIRAGPELF